MNVSTEIDNGQDVIDSRDVIARIEELTDEKDSLQSDIDDAETDEETETAQAALDNWAEADELVALESLADEAKDYAADWQYGESLIRDSYFTEYIMDMLKDCGDLPTEIPWYIAIDEDQTAENCKTDYTSVEFDGVTYYIR